MNLLLDTHIAIWALLDSPKLLLHIATITGQFCGAKRTRSGATGRFGAVGRLWVSCGQLACP